MSDFSAPKVKIINSEGSGWMGTQCFIDEKKDPKSKIG